MPRSGQQAPRFAPARGRVQSSKPGLPDPAISQLLPPLVDGFHKVIPLQSAIGHNNHVGLDPLLAGFQKAATHPEGFIIGVWSKHQPGSGR